MILKDELVVPKYLVALVALLRCRLRDPAFMARHRCRPEDFSRKRVLTFDLVVLFVLQKSTKSLQRHLNEFLAAVAEKPDWDSVTSGAWTQARAKLQPSAFVELNTQCLLPVAYGPERAAQLKRWRGHRLTGFDSSLVALPYSEALAQFYRVVEVHNQLGATGTRYCEGRLSVVYDLLNHLGLDGQLVSGSRGEVALAIEQLVHVQPNDVVLSDCGFTGFVYLVHIRHGRQAHFVSRCSPGSFLAAQELFRKDQEGQSVITRIFAPKDERVALKGRCLPVEMGVRFVSVRLPDGSLEVLVTSLLDPLAYPTQEFKEVYHWRWGHETYYFHLKSHLDLENWSGLGSEAVQQDFAASVFLSNLESLLTEPAQTQLERESGHLRHRQQVNHAVCYHTVKLLLLDLLAGDQPIEEVVRQMQKLFRGAPVSVRPERVTPRKTPSANRSYRFQRSRRKTVY